MSKAVLEQQHSMKYSLANLMNIYSIQKTPMQQYLDTYQQQSDCIREQLFQTKISNQVQIILCQFIEILNLKAAQIAKYSINKIDEIFGETQL